MLAGAEDHLATFSFPRVCQTIVKIALGDSVAKCQQAQHEKLPNRPVFAHIHGTLSSALWSTQIVESTSRALSGCDPPEIPKISRKESLRGSAAKSPKLPEKVEKCQNWTSGAFFDFIRYFRGLYCRPPKGFFLSFFLISGPEGPETPVNGRSTRVATPRSGSSRCLQPQPSDQGCSKALALSII